MMERQSAIERPIDDGILSFFVPPKAKKKYSIKWNFLMIYMLPILQLDLWTLQRITVWFHHNTKILVRNVL